jgi:tight adherence protein B
MHNGLLSAGALDDAVEQLRQEAATDREIMSALSSARMSARMLTALPFAFLALALLSSRTVRSGIASPAGFTVLCAGVFLNRTGARWMARSARSAAGTGDHLIPVIHDAGLVSHHIRAGGDIVSAAGVLGAAGAPWSAVHGALLRGDSLRDALEPLRGSHAGLVSVILSAHADGQPLLPALRAVVEDARHERRETTRAAVARLPAASTLPLVACVLPSFVLVSLIPVVLAATGGPHHPVL